MTDRIPVESLSFGAHDITPIDTDWNPEEYVEDRFRFWEAFEYELGERTFTLVASNGSVVAAFTDDGIRVDMQSGSVEVEEIECQNCDGEGEVEMTPIEGAEGLSTPPLADCPECNGTGNTAKITDDEITELEAVEPYQYGSEGPMMNYRYPLPGDSEESIGGYGNSTDAIGAAYRLRNVPLCVVECEDEIGLALTGGGMDLTWEIVDAFTTLGYLPPVHFSELPGMSGRGRDGYSSERDSYLIDAVDRSLREQVNHLQHQLDRHRQKYGQGISLVKKT